LVVWEWNGEGDRIYIRDREGDIVTGSSLDGRYTLGSGRSLRADEEDLQKKIRTKTWKEKGYKEGASILWEVLLSQVTTGGPVKITLVGGGNRVVGSL